MNPSLQQALKGGVAPTQEYLLQGSVLDSSKDVLLHRLQGLCDNTDTPREMFADHEMVFQLSKKLIIIHIHVVEKKCILKMIISYF